MATWKRLQQCLALLAGTMLAVPHMAWADDAKASRPAAQAAQAPQAIVPDVVLRKDGSFKGTLIDGAKNPLKKTRVLIKKDGKLLTTVETNDKGEYSVPGLKPGAYQIQIQERTAPVRLWNSVAAPAKSMKQLDMAYVPNADVVRGQLGNLDPVNASLLILSVTGVVLGAVAVSEIEEVEDIVKKPASP